MVQKENIYRGRYSSNSAYYSGRYPWNIVWDEDNRRACKNTKYKFDIDNQ
jgi:hypothetical protein